MNKRYYYGDSISDFLRKSTSSIIGEITQSDAFDFNQNQNRAWAAQIEILQKVLYGFEGELFFEFSIPRMGKRVDAILLIEDVVFVIEFKIGATEFLSSDRDQVWDYALDLKNFHAPSHHAKMVPIHVASDADVPYFQFVQSVQQDLLFEPIQANSGSLREVLVHALNFLGSNNAGKVANEEYISGSYSPTPTIIEAALTLYREHKVADIMRSDAAAANLNRTTAYILKTISDAQIRSEKVICFVTGVPGAGKTLIGLRVATEETESENGTGSVYLSGNGPLVAVLQEALARDRVHREKTVGRKITKQHAKSAVKAFIQNVHHYRDEYLRDEKAPYDHVAIFDEAQRAWNKEQTTKFMSQKKNRPDFNQSEPEFLISCLDRHKDWAVVICLVGGGQEIHTGEAGISEWLQAVRFSFPHWKVAISPNLMEKEYDALAAIDQISQITQVRRNPDLHLAVSMRSFRAENLSKLVKALLDRDLERAIEVFNSLKEKYPIVVTRDLDLAKQWLKERARGSERYGMVVSSQAQRLKPLAIDVRVSVNPVHWFLNSKSDVRSSYYLEDVATEFHIQGLELDWAAVIWDGDLRFGKDQWNPFQFKGDKWQHIRKPERIKYLLNAYRVLLTRARQGMVIVVPDGDSMDPTRLPEFYNPTFEYLRKIGFQIIE